MKKCYRCKETKPKDQFFKNKFQKDGLVGYCKPCHQQYTKDRPQYRQKWHLKNTYGISIAEKEQLLISQNNCCGICKQSFSNSKATHVDHCHITKKVRGILCSNCNTMLGLSKDNQEILQNAINYLGKYYGN
jgi:Recombination endonuclease VII